MRRASANRRGVSATRDGSGRASHSSATLASHSAVAAANRSVSRSSSVRAGRCSSRLVSRRSRRASSARSSAAVSRRLAGSAPGPPSRAQGVGERVEDRGDRRSLAAERTARGAGRAQYEPEQEQPQAAGEHIEGLLPRRPGQRHPGTQDGGGQHLHPGVGAHRPGHAARAGDEADGERKRSGTIHHSAPAAWSVAPISMPSADASAGRPMWTMPVRRVPGRSLTPASIEPRPVRTPAAG